MRVVRRCDETIANHGIMIEASKLRSFMGAKKMSSEIKAVNLMLNIFKSDALSVCVPGGPTDGCKRRGAKQEFDWIPLYAPAKKAILGITFMFQESE